MTSSRAASSAGSAATTSGDPWVVYLTDASGFQFCGGTLVTPTKVVTAAHCTASAPDRKTFVVVGRDDKQSQGRRPRSPSRRPG